VEGNENLFFLIERDPAQFPDQIRIEFDGVVHFYLADQIPIGEKNALRYPSTAEIVDPRSHDYTVGDLVRAEKVIRFVADKGGRRYEDHQQPEQSPEQEKSILRLRQRSKIATRGRFFDSGHYAADSIRII